MGWTSEERLLIDCLSLANRSSPPLDTTNLQHLDWNDFILSARREGVASFLFKTIQSSYLTKLIPDWVANELKRDYYSVLARNAVVFEELEKVLAVFNREGIECIVLKGVHLSEKIYRDRGVRSMMDVDLLIKPEDIKKIKGLLNSIGYYSDDLKSIQDDSLPSSYLTSVVFLHPKVFYTCFHLHWHIVNSSVPNQSLIALFDMSDVWSEAVKTEICGYDTLVLSANHLLLHLSEHSVRVTHSLSHLMHFCDLSETIRLLGPDIDWGVIEQQCKKSKNEVFLYVPLYLSRKLFCCDVPYSLLENLKNETHGVLVGFFLNSILKNRRFSGLSYLLHFVSNPGIFRKLHFLFRTIFPPKIVLAHRSAVPLKNVSSMIYLNRFFEIIWTMIKLPLKAVKF